MRLLGLGFLAVFLATIRLFAVSTPADIPSPRPQGWIVDQAQVLPTETRTALDRLLDEVPRHDGAEMAIVTVNTIGGADSRRFATELFNRWGIGDRTRDNGLLLFVALRDHKAEIVLGRGLDTPAQTARSDRIMRDIIVARFRAGDAPGAIDGGARACAEQFFGVGVPTVTGPERVETPAEPPARPAPPAPARPPAFSPFAVLVLMACAALAVVFLVWLIVHQARLAQIHNCPQCRLPMTKLDEAQDDAHLSAAELAEERIGSVDHIVWLCPSCLRVDKVRRGRWFTRYSACPRCGAQTRSSVSRTLAAATTVTTGLVEVREQCAHCNDSRVTTRVLPVLPIRPASTGRSSSGFGGGRSSGGGSSGRW